MNTTLFLRLGRVSNLPTVWSNTLAGATLAGVPNLDWRFAVLIVAMSLAYVGGMFLNDAFDRDIDARERPERPIPSGAVAAGTVFAVGAAQLAGAVVLVGWCAFGGLPGEALVDAGRDGVSGTGVDTSIGSTDSAISIPDGAIRAVLCAIALIGAIVAYDIWHKENTLSPLLMGLCRMLVYITVAFSLSATPASTTFIGALVLLSYLAGLTYTAKQESFGQVSNLWPLALLTVPVLYGAFAAADDPRVWWPTLLLVLCLAVALHFVRRRAAGDIPRAVGLMIAGIALVDAIFVSASAGIGLATFAVLAFMLTLLLQRYIVGT